MTIVSVKVQISVKDIKFKLFLNLMYKIITVLSIFIRILVYKDG